MVAVRYAWTIIVGLAGCHEVFGTENIVPPDAPPAYVSTVLADEPRGYYRLGEADGVVAHDLTGGPDGQYVSHFRLAEPGAIATDEDTSVFLGPEDATILFDDIHEYAVLAPFTLEAWIQPEFDGGFQPVAAKYAEPPTATGYVMYTLDQKLAFARGVTEQNQTLIEANVLERGVWTHVVATFDGAAMKLYANGVQVGERPSAIVLPDLDVKFTIGSVNGSQYSAPYHGFIDEVAIYDRGLSLARVFEHHAVGAAQAQRAR